jgi:PmbA protein
MKAYSDILASVPGVSAWVVRRSRSTEFQRYLLLDRPESERTVERTAVTVAILHDHDGMQGESSFTLFGPDAALDRRRVEEAIFMASLQSNPPYALPDPTRMRDVALRDPELTGDVRPVLDGVQDRLFSAVSREKGVRLSSSEIYVTRAETEILTSTGVEAASEETSILFDLVLLARDGNEETESHDEHRRRRLSDLKLEEIVARQARQARDSLGAVLPSTDRGPVVLSQGAFIPLLFPFCTATSAEMLYRKISPMTVGQPILGERPITGDALSIWSDATLPYGTGSAPFDELGLALGRVPVIEDGTFKTVIAPKRYADYLGVPPTGDWHNVVLGAGAAGRTELLERAGAPRLFHIVAFSWLHPDPVSGGFSTEIRLGYELTSEGTRVIKGGSLSGNAYDAFAAARFAEETELLGDYHGPVAVRFDQLQVTGS